MRFSAVKHWVLSTRCGHVRKHVCAAVIMLLLLLRSSMADAVALARGMLVRLSVYSWRLLVCVALRLAMEVRDCIR